MVSGLQPHLDDGVAVGSTLRNDTSKALLLERFAKAWDKRPDLTFGQLIDYATADFVDLDLETDSTIIQAIERFVLLGPKP